MSLETKSYYKKDTVCALIRQKKNKPLTRSLDIIFYMPIHRYTDSYIFLLK